MFCIQFCTFRMVQSNQIVNVFQVKLDGCYADCTQFDKTYPAVEKALNATGVPIGFHCDWSVYQDDHGIKPNYSSIAYTCNLWRSGSDIQDSWDSVYGIIQWFANNQDRLSPFHGPGQWFEKILFNESE